MLLEMKGIQKRFGGVIALRSGNLSVDCGEVHLLMGENGAGKSTLMKILAGIYEADAGEVLWNDKPVHFTKPAEAAAQGISMVHQESLLAPHLTVAENIFMGHLPGSGGGLVNRREMMKRAEALIAEHRFPLKAGWKVERLSPAQKQLVEICRAIQHGTSLLIFDEPTSSLSEGETKEVFRIVRSLRDRGCAVIYITHRLEELRTVGDRVTVLRDGQTVHSCALQELTTEQLIRHMVGRDVESMYTRQRVTPGDEILRVENVSNELLKDVSMSLRAGEIVGMGGLIGAGRTELCKAIFGIDPITSGRILVDGVEVKLTSPRHAVDAGIALIPEDRQRTGLATALPIMYNVTMASLEKVSSGGVLKQSEEKRRTIEFIQRLRIKASGPSQRAGRLSGGNQQKVAIAKWLAKGARIFLFDEPTRGIDVGAKVEVFEVMDELARAGAAILMVSSELPELLQVADRILVMRQGRISGELPGHCSQEDVMRLATFEEQAA